MTYGSDSTAWNRYVYAGDNPVNFGDSNGMFLKAVGQFFSNVGKAIVNTVTTVAKAVVNTVTTVAKAVVNTVKTVASAVVNTVKNVVSTVSTGIKNVVSTVSNTISSATSIAKALTKTYSSSGKSSSSSSGSATSVIKKQQQIIATAGAISRNFPGQQVCTNGSDIGIMYNGKFVPLRTAAEVEQLYSCLNDPSYQKKVPQNVAAPVNTFNFAAYGAGNGVGVSSGFGVKVNSNSSLPPEFNQPYFYEGPIGLMIRKTIEHNAVADAVAIQTGGVQDRKTTGIAGASKSGLFKGYPDVMVVETSEVYEVKPDTKYGHSTGPEQMARYTNNTGYVAGKDLDMTTVVMDSGKVLDVYFDNGVVYYRDHDTPQYDPSPVVVPEAEKERSTSKSSSWVNPPTGDDGFWSGVVAWLDETFGGN